MYISEILQCWKKQMGQDIKGGAVSLNILGTTGKSETNDNSFESPDIWLLGIELKLDEALKRWVPRPLY